jgi:hypothetical protein
VSTGIPMLCAHCQRPAASGVWLGQFFYHEECTRGPGWQTQYWGGYPSGTPAVVPPLLTEERVRQIVREELERANG